MLYPHRSGTEPEEVEQVFEGKVAVQTMLNLSVTDLGGKETLWPDNLDNSALHVYFAELSADLSTDEAAIFYLGDTPEGTTAAAGHPASVRQYPMYMTPVKIPCAAMPLPHLVED